jgi:hypothetical protein
MKYIFILYAFDIIKFIIFVYIVDQTLQSLTLTKPNMHPKLGMREYICNLTINHVCNLGIVVPYLTSKEPRSQTKCRTWSIKEDTIKAAWKKSF